MMDDPKRSETGSMQADALFDAIRRGDADAVRRLLEKQPALASARNPQGETPVLTAVYHNRPAVLEALRARGRELDLYEAAAVGDLAAAREAMSRDSAAIGARSGDGWTALHLAVHFGRSAVVDFLLEHGADVHARSSNGMRNQPLHAAAAGRAATAMVARLLARGASVDATQGGGFTALHESAFKGDTELARLLLAHGADVKIATDESETAAAIATRHGHAELARLLAGDREARAHR